MKLIKLPFNKKPNFRTNFIVLISQNLLYDKIVLDSDTKAAKNYSGSYNDFESILNSQSKPIYFSEERETTLPIVATINNNPFLENMYISNYCNSNNKKSTAEARESENNRKQNTYEKEKKEGWWLKKKYLVRQIDLPDNFLSQNLESFETKLNTGRALNPEEKLLLKSSGNMIKGSLITLRAHALQNKSAKTRELEIAEILNKKIDRLNALNDFLESKLALGSTNYNNQKIFTSDIYSDAQNSEIQEIDRAIEHNTNLIKKIVDESMAKPINPTYSNFTR